MQVSSRLWRVMILLSVSTPGLADESVDSAAAQPSQMVPGVDRFGDPIPDGSKVRLGTVRLRQNGHSVEGVAFSPDGKYVVSVGWEDSIRFWDLVTGKLARRLVADDIDEGTFAVAFSPHGGKLASVGEQGHVCLWNLETGKRISKTLGHLEGKHGARVYGVAFSPNGLTFATAGGDDTVRLWDTTTSIPLLEFQTDEQGGDVRPVAFSPDGRLLASGSPKGAIHIWNLPDGGEAK